MNDGDVAPFGVDPLTHFHCNTFFFWKPSHKIPNPQCPSAFAFLVSPLSWVGLLFQGKAGLFWGKVSWYCNYRIQKGRNNNRRVLGTIFGMISGKAAVVPIDILLFNQAWFMVRRSINILDISPTQSGRNSHWRFLHMLLVIYCSRCRADNWQ